MKRETMTRWRQLYAQPVTSLDIENRYDELIREADGMLRNRIINDREWRELVRAAGSLLCRREKQVLELDNKMPGQWQTTQ